MAANLKFEITKELATLNMLYYIVLESTSAPPGSYAGPPGKQFNAQATCMQLIQEMENVLKLLQLHVGVGVMH